MLSIPNSCRVTDEAIHWYLHDTLGFRSSLRPWKGARTRRSSWSCAPRSSASGPRRRCQSSTSPTHSLPTSASDWSSSAYRSWCPAISCICPISESTCASTFASRRGNRERRWLLGEVVARLGYTPMTLTRVLRELDAAGLAKTTRHGRARHLYTEGTPRELWQGARKSMRSPVKRSVWIRATARDRRSLRMAGLSALARLTRLADPPWPVYAMGRGRLAESKAGWSRSAAATRRRMQ